MTRSTQPVAKTKSPSGVFVAMALDMSWRLALVVLVPVVVGAELDKAFKTSPALVIVGFVLAMIGTGFVLWQTLQTAGRQPVPKLTPAQKRRLKQQNEEDDD